MNARLLIYAGVFSCLPRPVGRDYWLRWNESPQLSKSESGAPGPRHEIDFLSRLEADNLANRRAYLRWIHQLGTARTRRGQSVAQALRPAGTAASFWWLSLIAEKSPLKSTTILEAFKLMTLERLVRELRLDSLVLISSDRRLAACLERFCRQANLRFEWLCLGAGPRAPWPKRLPHLVRALAWVLREYWQRVRLARRHRLARPKQNQREATVVTYFPNFENEAAKAGNFRSRYWVRLHDWLEAQKTLTVNWIWIHVNSSQASFNDAWRHKQAFQRQGKDNFYLLEEFLKPQDLLRTLVAFLVVAWRGWRLQRDPKVQAAFSPESSALDFQPLFQDEWAKSCWGTTAMENCLWQRKFARMQEALSTRQEWGVYPFEFQAWEKVLAATWRQSSRHGRLIAYQHATVGALMLNYFHDAATFLQRGKDALPRPDFIAVNGPLAKAAFVVQGYPPAELVEVEALRFLYIKEAEASVSVVPKHATRRLLVACDMMRENSRRQLGMLTNALRHLNEDRPDFEKIWVKPHPFCPIGDIVKAYGLSPAVEVVDGNIADYLREATHVFTANSTSVALEALALHKHAAACVGLDALNLSPLFGIDEGHLIRSTNELVEFLSLPTTPPSKGGRFFNFDRSLAAVLDGTAENGDEVTD